MRRAILDIYSFSPLHRVLHSQLSGMSFKVIRGWFTTYFPHVLNHHQWEKHDLLLSPETTTRGRPHAANSATFLCFIKNIQEPGPALLILTSPEQLLPESYILVGFQRISSKSVTWKLCSICSWHQVPNCP